MQELKDRALSRDEFTTMLTEAASIVNNTPLQSVPTDQSVQFMFLLLSSHRQTWIVMGRAPKTSNKDHLRPGTARAS